MSKLGKLKDLYSRRGTLMKQLRWMAVKTKPFLPRLIVLVAVELGVLAISLACTLINKQLIDRAQPAAGPRVFDARALVILAVLTLVSIGIHAIGDIVTTLIRERYTTGIRAEMFRRTVRGNWLAINARHSGDTVTRLTADVDSVASGIADMLPAVIYLTFELIASFVILSLYDVYLALAALALGPLCVLAGWMFGGRLQKYEIALKENNADQRAFIQESVANITVLKAFEQQDNADRRLNELRAQRLRLIRSSQIYKTFIHLTMELLLRGGYLLAFGWGIWQISRGAITYGTMSVFLSLVGRVQTPMMSMSSLLTRFVDILASAGRVMELEKMPPEPEKGETGLACRVGVKLTNVSFGYGDKKVLDGVSMDIAPGKRVGLVGESGIGKTTVARLILALISPDQGDVMFYDETGRRETAGVDTRCLVSYVPQENTLMSGTIRENLLTGNADATDDEMWQALAAAEADGFVRAAQGGLDARVGERGIGVSEGQAQRIVIARALLRKNALLILDEATASLDMDTENRIMNNLKTLCRERTCLIITHRPSLLEMCDEIVRM